MKRFVIFLFLVLSVSIGIAAQETVFYESTSDHYLVYSEIGTDHARSTARILEAFSQDYNDIFHFDRGETGGRMTVRIFATKESYNEYLQSLLDVTREDFVYLHYSDPERNQLLGFQRDDESFQKSLAHYGFIQFLKNHINNPPIWMREGFASYFRGLRYSNQNGASEYLEYLAWLPSLKKIISRGETIPINEMITMDSADAAAESERFYPMAWGLVDFLLHTEQPDYRRVLWDSISSLRSSAGVKENSLLVKRKAFGWVGETGLNLAFIEYIKGKKTFSELVQTGVSAYRSKNYTEAEKHFESALDRDSSHHAPYYYLGLIRYNRGDYLKAEYFYQTALQRGADSAVTYYALGLNALADNRNDDAREYLEKAKERDPAYTERVDNLLQQE
ncbi:MAG: tetratricopeptide repeat protein [Spirochaetales bacterium]|nr:tetratricopeptide repeat protein [Spirochaetales bacterium]MCF7937155.1 tetratricopeptide repeat protein [Spirochaetales bacterium]